MDKSISKCNSIQVLLGELLLETISDADRVMVREHLLNCAECRAELEELRNFYGVLEEYPVPLPDPAFSKRVTAAIFREIEEERFGHSGANAGKLPWYRRSRLVLGISTGVAAVATVAVSIGISPMLGGIGSFVKKDSSPEEIRIESMGAKLPYVSRENMEDTLATEGNDIVSLEITDGIAIETEETGRVLPDKYSYWESKHSGGGIASTTGETTSTDFDAEYIEALRRKADDSYDSYKKAKGTGEEGVRRGSWRHPSVGIETASLGGSNGAKEYYDDDLYHTLMELSPEERTYLLRELEEEGQ